jgi:hypothetical protein
MLIRAPGRESSSRIIELEDGWKGWGVRVALQAQAGGQRLGKAGAMRRPTCDVDAAEAAEAADGQNATFHLHCLRVD